MNRLLFIILTGCCLLLQPQVAAAAKQHPAVPAEQDCAECHASQEKVWFDGKHGLMNVKCIACHGATDKNFTNKPGVASCRGCHADQVAQAQKAKGKEGKNCFPCHVVHALTAKSGATGLYHAKGGK